MVYSFGSWTPFTRELLDKVPMPNTLFSDRTEEGEEEEEDAIAAILNASASKPPIAAITNSTVAAITSEGGRRGEVFFVAAADAIFNFITKLTIVPSLHKQRY